MEEKKTVYLCQGDPLFAFLPLFWFVWIIQGIFALNINAIVCVVWVFIQGKLPPLAQTLGSIVIAYLAISFYAMIARGEAKRFALLGVK